MGQVFSRFWKQCLIALVVSDRRFYKLHYICGCMINGVTLMWCCNYKQENLEFSTHIKIFTSYSLRWLLPKRQTSLPKRLWWDVPVPAISRPTPLLSCLFPLPLPPPAKSEQFPLLVEVSLPSFPATRSLRDL